MRSPPGPSAPRPLPGWDRDGSPYHAGEQAVQARAGARDRAERMGRKVIRSFMPDQHRAFFAELPFVVLGSLDGLGRPWASVLAGPPGFLRSPDPRRLVVAARPLPDDPLAANLQPGAAVGLLGIQPETRRRNRMNGRVIELGDGRFTLAVDQSFGNCPQYIQARTPHFVADSDPGGSRPSARREGPLLSAEAAGLIRTADTFFIATASPGAGSQDPVEGADVNHRGGRPGFVDLRQEDGRTLLVAPDFAGNAAFATFGNLLLNPKAGLLFADFAAGHLLLLTGSAEVIWNTPEVRAFPGAERLLHFRVSEGLFLERALPLRWSDPRPAPQVAATGTWAEVAKVAQGTGAAAGAGWRPFVVARVEAESGTARSLHLLPQDGGELPPHLPGQFLPIAVELPGSPQPLRRPYTISSAPDGRGYRLTVKRSAESGGRASVSNWLHDHAREGTVIRALAPRGDFVLDPDSDRPVLLLSAGIGATPLVAMLEHLTGGDAGRPPRPDRPIFYVHAARDGAEQVFAGRVRSLARDHANLTVHLRHSRPRPRDRRGRDHDSVGRIDKALLRSLLPLDDYDVYLCGPAGFMQTAYGLLIGLGVADRRIHAEAFGPARLHRRPAAGREQPATRAPSAGAEVTFRRSGLRVPWSPAKGTLLDLAEAAGIEAPWSCRAGVCGTCSVPVAEGAVAYPEAPAAGCRPDRALVCSAVPATPEIVLDL